MRAPSARSVPTKRGKLVPMQSQSTIVLGPRAAEREDRRGHRDAVVAIALDARGLERAFPALDDEAVRELLARDAERAEQPRHRRDAIALLDAELLGIADRRRSDRARGERARDRDLARSRAERARRRSTWRAGSACHAVTSRTGSPPCSPCGTTSRPAPMWRATSRRPMRVGLMPTPRTVTREPGWSCAATRRNAAADTSPGISMSNAAHLAVPSCRIELDHGADACGAARPARAACARCGRARAPAP